MSVNATPPSGVMALRAEVVSLQHKFDDHAKLDQEQLGAIATELAKVRTEQATKADTSSQTRTLAVITSIITAVGAAVGAAIHYALGG